MKHLLPLLCLFCAAHLHAFERLALIDSYDFGTVFDTETATGSVQVLEHVLRTHADTILWRNCSGGLARYQSAEEQHPLAEPPLDLRRIPDSRAYQGWMRYDQCTPDLIRTIFDECSRRKIGKGIHWPYEETHWQSWTLGAWNLEHPQFWAVSRNGQPWHGRASLSFTEVLAHKLRLLDELLSRGADVIYIDTCRNGGWTPAREYTLPNLSRWKELHGEEPLPLAADDDRWLAVVSESQHAFLRAIRKRLDKERRKVRFIFGVDGWSLSQDFVWKQRAINWRQLAKEDVFDAISIMSVKPDAKDALESTRKLYRAAIENSCGLPVYFPIMSYNFPGRPGYIEYAKWWKCSEAEAARKLLALAKETGGAGVTFECVDFRNYSDAVCEVLK